MGRLNAPKKRLVGRTNADLFRSILAAKETENHAEFNRLKALLLKSQTECLHPETEHRTAKKISPVPGKRYKKGDNLTWCFRCGKVLEHNGQEVGEELPLTLWERLLDESPFEHA